MRIAFFELEGWEESAIRAAFPGEDLFLSKDKIMPVSLQGEKDFEVVSVFVDSRFDRETIAQFPNLKCIATRSTGYDHVDLSVAAERGIMVVYVPGYGDNTVAEYAFGLILNLSRKIHSSLCQVKETGTFSLGVLRGVDLKGKTLGVIGTGRIGREVIVIGKGFGMNIVAHDPYPDAAFAQSAGVSYMKLDDLLGASDFITIHCPLLESTRHLINSGNVEKIKRGAYLVNTARGSIVETEALVRGLEDGILGGVGLDVLEEEGETKDELEFLLAGHPKEEDLRTILENHVLMKMPNVLITPHNAFNSQEALQRILATTIGNIKGFLAGVPVNIAK